jgi:hypothetical protein
VKLLLDLGARPLLAGLAAGVLLVAGCSSGRSLPSTAAGSGLAPSSRTTAGLGVTGIAPEGFVPDACTDPKILKVCVRPGGSAKLGIKLTCHSSGVTVPCGKVRWSTRMSHAGLAGTFKPDPGNPTTETVTATKSTKVGHYFQTITARCTGVPSCVVHGKGAVWVI